MKYKYIDEAYDEDGNPVLEFCCSHCRAAAFVNMPEDYYEDLWLNKHGHWSHVVIRPEEDYLL